MVFWNAVVAALTATGLISLAPNLLLILFPQYASGEGEASKVLALGQALAAGGLLGDVFLHTIPHSNGSDDMGLWILLGFSAFLVADMLIRSLGPAEEESRKGAAEAKPNGDHHSHNNHHAPKSSVVLLNLAADALHNFTDGLAIGASFAVYTPRDGLSVAALLSSRGGLATISILFHEIPHELGDFAILVKSGFSKQEAILAQFGTAVAAMLGSVVGLFLQQWVGDYLIFMTAGGFVYLAAVTILPEILDERASAFFRVSQLACFAAGIAFMYAVSLLEAHEAHGGNGHHDHHHDHHHESHKLGHEHLHHHHEL